MLNNNNHNHQSCAFAEQIISYLYGEINAADIDKFETHLKSCSTCGNDLKGFKSVRDSVLDWRAEEFLKLEIPIFQIPTPSRAESLRTIPASIERYSWFANLRRIFSFNPAWAAVLGILVFSIGIALFAFRFSGSEEVAENKEGQNPVQAVISPKVEITKKPEEINIVGKVDEKLPPASIKNNNSSAEEKRNRQIVQTKQNVKVTGNAPKNSLNNSVRSSNEANVNIKKTSPVQKRRVPTLTDTVEDEDNSIRLADLFAEIDTK